MTNRTIFHKTKSLFPGALNCLGYGSADYGWLVARQPMQMCACGTVQIQQTRGLKKRAPKVAGDRDKWISKSLKLELKKRVKVIPKNWEKFMMRVPQDDVWIRTYFPPWQHTLAETVDMHRELASPEMLDNMDGYVHVDLDLDMRTAKKTKFMNDFSALVDLPYNFDDGTDNKVLVFCKEKEEMEAALEAGAKFAGGQELIKLMEKGDIKVYMFDYAVCSVDYYDEILKARKHIRDKFPNQKAGSVAVNVLDLVRRFRFGKTIETEKTSQAESHIRFTIGKLDMPTEHLLANFQAYIEECYKHKTKSKLEGPYVIKAFVTCPPSGERLHLTPQELINPEDQITSHAPTIPIDEDEAVAVNQ